MVEARIIESEPAMILQEQKKHLIITDLHIGFENTFSTNKIFLGDDSSIKQITTNVKKLIQNHSVDSVILLGDIKSSISQISKNEWNDIPYFFDEIKKISDITLIPGNHDAGIEKLVSDEVTMLVQKVL